MSPTRSLFLALCVLVGAAALLGVGVRLGSDSPGGILLLIVGIMLALLGLRACFREPARRAETLIFAACLAAVMGALALYLVWKPWREYASSDPEPQPISVRHLIEQGYGGNRHVLIRDFAFCKEGILADEQLPEENKVAAKFIWLPIVPVDQRTKGLPGDQVSTPRKVQVLVLSEDTIHRPPTTDPAPLEFLLLANKQRRSTAEKRGWQGMVRNGFLSLSSAEKERLLQVAPDTDVEEVILVDFRKPPAAEEVYGLLGGGIGMVVFGVVVFLVVLGSPRRQQV